MYIYMMVQKGLKQYRQKVKR